MAGYAARPVQDLQRGQQACRAASLSTTAQHCTSAALLEFRNAVCFNERIRTFRDLHGSKSQ